MYLRRGQSATVFAAADATAATAAAGVVVVVDDPSWAISTDAYLSTLIVGLQGPKAVETVTCGTSKTNTWVVGPL